MNESPFNPKAALAIVLFGVAVFIGLLWMIGSGMTGGSANDGGGHVGGKGLNGYAALADYLEKREFPLRRSRNKAAYLNSGLLVLTPPHTADGAELQKIVAARRRVGPTLIITPKWLAGPISNKVPGAKKGWVELSGTETPSWKGFLDNVSAGIAPMQAGSTNARWSSSASSGALPDAKAVQSGTGNNLVPLVQGQQDGRILAGYFYDGGHYPQLDSAALQEPEWDEEVAEDEGLFPLIVVFEPDLIDNYGMSQQANAQLAERLFRLARGNGNAPIVFDMTLNGFARSANLLTLAFTPPFLAATLCLAVAALAVGWRAFLRFGPPRRTTRAIAFGKRALISNAAGLIQRTRRLHLVAAPYADHARERLAKALALPRMADKAATEAAIDRALAGRSGNPAAFSNAALRLRHASRASDIVKAAQDLHALERTLKR
jgi:hypothetical protein